MTEEHFVELANRARTLLPILREQARRSFVLEITGTPKAGKTTSVAVLERFFKDCGFRVHVLKEKAAEWEFFLLERWRGLVDATIVVTTTPETAIERENAPLIVPRSGSVMQAVPR